MEIAREKSESSVGIKLSIWNKMEGSTAKLLAI